MATQRKMSKERSIAAILEAGLAEFAEFGYLKATIRSIASRAGLASGLINRYFESKDNLLCEILKQNNLKTIYGESEETDPFRIFCIYLDYVRKSRKDNPARFRLMLRVVSENEFPDVVSETIRAEFEGSVLEEAIRKEQEAGELVAGDPFSLFNLLSGSVYVLLNQYAAIGAEAPDNDALLAVIGFSRDKGLIRRLRDITQQEAKLRESHKIIGALAKDYSGVNYIELTDNSLNDITVGYRTSSFLKSVIPGWDNEKNFSRRLDMLYDTVVFEPDKKLFYEETRLANVESRLREADSYSVYTRFLINNEIQYYEIKFSPVRENNELTGIVAGLRSIDKQRKAEIEFQRRLGETLSFTNYFLDRYVSAYYVGLDSLTCQIYRQTDGLRKSYPGTANWLEELDAYIACDVHPDDRRLLTEITRPANLKQALENQAEVTCVLRDISEGTEKIYRFQAIRGADRAHAAFGFIDITEEINEQNRRIKEMEESRRLIDSIAGSYDVSYIVNMSDDSIHLLKMSEKIAGRKEIETFSRFSEIRNVFARYIHFSDRERLQKEMDFAVIRQKLAGTDSYNMEYRAVIDDETAWYEMNITRISADEFAIGFAEKDLEITKRRLEEKRYDEYFALFAVDIDTQRLKVLKNEAGYRAAAVGESVPYTAYIQGLAGQFDGEVRDFFMQLSDIDYAKKELASDDKRTFAYKSVELPGDKWIDLTAYCILRHEDGTPAMFTIGFSVVDALATAREELRRRLAEALSTAEAASRAKSEFLFNMSHDVRTPMNAIMGFTQIALKNTGDRYMVTECLGKVQSAGEFLLTLINDILDLAKIEQGKLTVEEEEVILSDLLVSLEDIFTDSAEDKNLKLTFECDELSEDTVWADNIHLSRILMNILSNAVKYTKPGGSVAMSLRERPGDSKEEGTYVFTVEDTGIGMTREFVGHIFDQFSRERSAASSGIQGTGLGMAITKKLVELLRGEISVESEFGRGTKVTVSFPFRYYNDTRSSREKRKASDVKEVRFDGMRVLLAEDNLLNREIAMDVLNDMGVVVEEAEDGAAAVSKVVSSKPGYYHLILMDVQMPYMDGYQATKAIRNLENKELAGIPICALSANVFPEDKRRSREAGMNGHLEKPLVLPELVRVLEEYAPEGAGKILSDEEEFMKPDFTDARKTENPDENRQTVLITDDSEINRRFLKRMLEKKYNIVEAENGREALDLLRSGKTDVHLILLDLSMPVMTGFEFMEEWKKDPSISHIPVMVQTAGTSSEGEINSLRLGASDFVKRPYQSEIILHRVANVLRRKAEEIG